MEQPRWISVEERLPEVGQEVFVYGPREAKRMWPDNPLLFYPEERVIWQTRRAERPDCCTDGNSFLRTEGYADAFITHWFPMPSFDGAEGPRWISVGERLPGIGEEVFVFGTQLYDGERICKVIIEPTTMVWRTLRAEKPSSHTDGNQFCRLRGYGIYKITHWHPLPALAETEYRLKT